ncbi:MAG: AAA family ATPase [Gemmatimonadaceae bacterium]|nr:AAA family ATPase [Gemmatimonadaceae bacterium]
MFTPLPMPSTPPRFPPLPLVGRREELSFLSDALDRAKAGRGRTIVLVGEGGVGKSRLATMASEHAEGLGFTVAVGRAYPVETGVPYALFADALVPILTALEPGQLAMLARGAGGEVARLFPALAPEGRPPEPARASPADAKARLFWSFAQMLSRMASRRPMLLVLENLQWADESSLELLHFVARQIAKDRVLIVGNYNASQRDGHPTLAATERSLVALGAADVLTIGALEERETDELLQRTFDAPASATRDFARRLHAWTGGNPYFVEETLKALVAEGALREERGRWVGWDRESFILPPTILDALTARLGRLTTPALAVAELVAVLGAGATLPALDAVSGEGREDLAAALAELRAEHVVDERVEGGVARYDLSHPLLREALLARLGAAGTRVLHEKLATRLEKHYGARAEEHADELAAHFARASSPKLAARATRYLGIAGRNALALHADREAVNYLATALDLSRRSGDGAESRALSVDLARARQRVGDSEGARALWLELRDSARAAKDVAGEAAIERRLGLLAYWNGRFADAIEHLDAAIVGGGRAKDSDLALRASLAKGVCLVELGRRGDAKAVLDEALAAAERAGSPQLLARVHRALLLLYAWTGPADRARVHGAEALRYAREARNPVVEATVHWALAMLGGLTGKSREVAEHLAETNRIADELHSPMLRVWAGEIEIEYASGTGDWDGAIAIADRTIALARSMGQGSLLPRVLVWSALVHLGRGDVDRARGMIEEAERMGQIPDGDGGRRSDLQRQLPGMVGRVALALATRDFPAALHIGERALGVVERSGYVVWAIHRLLPMVAEAALWASALDRARALGARLRADSERVGHELGIAWADACDALVDLLEGNAPHAVALLRASTERLEAIPFVPDAARLRRQLARALAETGDREGAARELRRAHDVFAKLGAQPELEATREQLRELGARPPALVAARGAEGLTGREIEIIRLVVARRSNKEIGVALGISPRTVSTHLSNIFEKLNVTSRGELADAAREQQLVGR